MLGVVGDAEVPADDDGDAGRGPQVGGPSVAGGALQEQAFQLGQLGVGQAVRAVQGDGVEAAGGACEADPAVDGGALDAEDAGDGGGGLAFAVGRDGAL